MGMKILLADDHPLILKGTKDFLIEEGYSGVSTCGDGQSAYNLILKEKPKVIILDYNMPKINGLELAKICRKENLSVKIILLTLQKNELILKEVGSIIDGYLLKEDALDKLKICLETVVENKIYISPILQKSSLGSIIEDDFINKLTSSEIKILNQIAKNKSSQEIAESLFISKRTVEKHRSNIIQKLELSKKGDALKEFVFINKSKFNNK